MGVLSNNMFKSILSYLKNLLKRFPSLDRNIRSVYLGINYIVAADYNFRFALKNDVRIMRIEEWAGVDIMTGETYFGYYDKSPWSNSDEAFLLHNKPYNNVVKLKLLRKDISKVIEIGESEAWTYQQGSMLQWLTNNDSDNIIYNYKKDTILGCIIYNIKNHEKRFIPWPIQCIHPSGNYAYSLNYLRLLLMNSEYGYVLKVDNFNENNCNQENDGIWLLDLKSGKEKLIITIANLLTIQPREDMYNSDHGINHILVSPDGNRIIFIHRWITKYNKRISRLYTSRFDGDRLKLLLDNDMVSHYCWLDNHNILTYASTNNQGDGYYIIDCYQDQISSVISNDIKSYGDGHPSIAPIGRWIITDTYPNKARVRKLLLWNINDGRIIEIGSFYSPLKYEGGLRCDLHPRWDHSGKYVSIDSTHEGVRKSYVIDVSAIISS
jgi:hypothetical protein